MAESWGELTSLLNNDTTLEDALGLKPFSADGHDERLTVQGVGGINEVFSYKLPKANEVKLLGLTDIDETLTVLPPYLDLGHLLEPMYIPEPVTEEPLQDECHIAGLTSPTSDCVITQEVTRKRNRQESTSPRTPKRLREHSDTPELVESSDDSVCFIDLS